MSYHIAITETDQPIWGAASNAGDAIEEAIAYGRSCFSGAEELREYEAALEAIPCTERLARAVASQGGNLAWDINEDGLADIWE